MTDQLTADVERWLAEQVRTTWPGQSGDCCDAGERADMARWFAGQIRAFEAWRGKQSIVHVLSVAKDDGEAAVCPVTASELPNSTPTAQGTNRTPQSDVVTKRGFGAVEPSSKQRDVVNTLLEAAGAARTRTLPPPKPGTHESDLIRGGLAHSGPCMTHGFEYDICEDANCEQPGSKDEFRIARAWTRRNSKENT